MQKKRNKKKSCIYERSFCVKQEVMSLDAMRARLRYLEGRGDGQAWIEA